MLGETLIEMRKNAVRGISAAEDKAILYPTECGYIIFFGFNYVFEKCNVELFVL